MSFFSWMRAARDRPVASPGSAPTKPTLVNGTNHHELTTTHFPMEPSRIADVVEAIREENERARKLCEKADAVVKSQQHQLTLLREQVRVLEVSKKKATAKINELEKKLKNPLASQLLQAQNSMKVAQDKCKEMEKEVVKARTLARAHEFVDIYSDKNIPADPTSALLTHADLRPSPFVVILVDADSYQFHPGPNINRTVDIQGRETAHNLQREVSKYILSHPRIPPHSKIICRIMCNRSHHIGKIVRRGASNEKGNQMGAVERKPSPKVEIMLKMAETYPLFDFIECGGGKERVDDKIRENCHLFISDSNCHALFLAVCNDSGYARMLERYDGNPTAAAKIILLTNGEITREMKNLSFPKVELADVFTSRYVRKRDQGSASKAMGLLLPTSQLPSHEDASSYDVDYSLPPSSSAPVARVNAQLHELRVSKNQQKVNAKASAFARLPYETDERYEERLLVGTMMMMPQQPQPMSASSRLDVMLSKRDQSLYSVGFIGLSKATSRKPLPPGISSTAPPLPFLILARTRRDAISLVQGGSSTRITDKEQWNDENCVDID